MQAIILAAGRGERLAQSNPDGRPKCLLEFGGMSLLERQLRALGDNGLRQVCLVVGYQANRVAEHVGGLRGIPHVQFVHNPVFEAGSVLSLHAARAHLAAGGRVLVLDADVLFHPEILRRLCRSEHPNCFLVDRGYVPDEEAVKVALRGARMVDFRKRLAPDLEWESVGESVGFFGFQGGCAKAVAAACLRYANHGPAETPHEEALRDVLLARPDWFGFEDISGIPWVELDFPADVQRAEQVILPAIDKEPGTP